MNEYPEHKQPAFNQAPPPNYLVWSILSTIFCCPPLGIVSIVYAAQVNSKWQMGDTEGARLSSKNARLWALITLGVGLVGGFIWTMLVLLGILGGIGMEVFESWS